MQSTMDEPLDADHHWDHARQKCLKVELKVELRAQPKIGRLAHQAAVVLNSAGWTKSSREQAPACYTSARHQASRCETDVALLWGQGTTSGGCAKMGSWPTEAPKGALGPRGRPAGVLAPGTQNLRAAGCSQPSRANGPQEDT